MGEAEWLLLLLELTDAERADLYKFTSDRARQASHGHDAPQPPDHRDLAV